MPDRRRIITMSAGGRPILELDLEVAPNYEAIGDTFAYAPGQANAQESREPGRYGGSTTVGEQNDNGTVSWSALVRGNTPDQVAQNVEALLESANRATRGRLFEWRPDGVTYSSYFRIAGPATWKPGYSWAQFTGAGSLVVDISIPVRPLVLWDPMTIVDPFDVDSRTDYSFDASTSADVNVTGGVMVPVVGAALTVERRARHTVRGYTTLEGQATRKYTPGSTISGFKGGVTLRGSAANTYVEVYVDDNGTNSRLRVDVVIAGVVTNRQSTNLGARISNGTAFWVRGRIEGQLVIAEYFTALPTGPIDPTTANSYTLSGGEQASLVAGYSGWSWIPQHASATADDFEFKPYARASTTNGITAPVKISWLDAIPGTAPALADIALGRFWPSQSTWALFAWSAQRAAHLGVYDASDATLSGWASASDSNGLGGTIAKVTTTSSAGVYKADWPSSSLVDLQPDDFTDGRCELEIWARVSVASTLSDPRLSFWLEPYAGSTFGQQFAIPYGSAYKHLLKPASGTVRRRVRLGTISVPADTLASFTGNLHVEGRVSSGGSGEFGLDYMSVYPANRRICSPTGVSSGYPAFKESNGTKITRSDLSGVFETATGDKFDAHGMCGSTLIVMQPGPTDLYVELASVVPDDPANTDGDDTLDVSASHNRIYMDVTPRSYMLRGS